MEQEYITKQYKNGTRKLYKAVCSICGKDRGYKKLSAVKGKCKSCNGKLKHNTLNVVKSCIECKTTHVPNPSKQWFAGPTCYKCYALKYRKTHKEEISISIKKWKDKNKEHVQKRERSYRLKNKQKIDKLNKVWRLNNLEHIRKLARNRQKTREQQDPSFKISRRIRARFYKMTKYNDSISFDIMSKYVSYSMKDLVEHLESQFELWMNWDNYGVHGWHIDHIIPLCSFDLTIKDEIIKACSLNNLRPLKCTQNWSKSSEDKKCKKKSSKNQN